MQQSFDFWLNNIGLKKTNNISPWESDHVT